jgi:hypothetical protein
VSELSDESVLMYVQGRVSNMHAMADMDTVDERDIKQSCEDPPAHIACDSRGRSANSTRQETREQSTRDRDREQ